MRYLSQTLACVTCSSATAHQVRAGIFGPHFFPTLLLVAAPFPILLALAAAIYIGLPVPRLRQAAR